MPNTENTTNWTTWPIYTCHDYVYTSRYSAWNYPGYALDNSDNGKVFKSLLHLSKEDEQALQSDIEKYGRNDVIVYRRCYFDPNEWPYKYSYGDYYLNYHEAEELPDGDTAKIPENRKNWVIQDVVLNLKKLPELPKFFNVVMKVNDKGRLYCRINTHPELYGHRAEGKFFFPDASWKDVEAGEASVTITSEKEKYGFVTGENLRKNYATQAQALDLLWSEGHFSGIFTSYISENPKKPNIYGYRNRESYYDNAVRVFMQTKNDKGETVAQLEVISDEEYDSLIKSGDYSFNNGSAFAAIALDNWDLQAGDIPIYTLLNNLAGGRSKYFEQPNRLSLAWSRGKVWYEPKDELLQRALKEGWITPIALNELNNVQVYHVDMDTFGYSLVLDFESWQKLVEAIAKANKEADKAIENAVKKGKIGLK